MAVVAPRIIRADGRVAAERSTDVRPAWVLEDPLSEGVGDGNYDTPSLLPHGWNTQA